MLATFYSALIPAIEVFHQQILQRLIHRALAEVVEKLGMKSRPLLQVHDELMFEVAAGEKPQLQELVRNMMSQAFKLSVPLDVNIGIGKSWDQAAH